MKSKRLIWSSTPGLIIIILFSIALTINLAAASTVVVDQQVKEQLDEEGTVNVLVKLKDEATVINANLATEYWGRNEYLEENLESRKEAIHQQQDRVINRLPEEEFQLGHRYDTLNGFSAKITKNSLKKLLRDPNVEAIQYDYPLAVNLDESILQISADEVQNFQINGINITGTGQTVCVIDTGIDYTHSALGNCSIVQLTLTGEIENLSNPIESEHPYSNNHFYNWTITKPGYTSLALHFKQLRIESNYDFLHIYDQDHHLIASYSGTRDDIWTPAGEGDTLYIEWETDFDTTDYGIYIDQVINGTTNMAYDWNSCPKVIGGWDFYNSDGDPYDDNGHGTHVAGIISSADSVYQGVAPEVKLAAVKILSSTGSGTDSGLAAGIDWCINNSIRYNISVISLSLGCNGGSCTHWQTACDSSAETFFSADSINTAAELGITVAVASGNSGWTDGISSPACVSGSVPVGAVTGTDSIIYNRGNLLTLLAPGTGITSSYNGGFASLSGTSMAAPHFSGAAALFKQYWNLAYGLVPTAVQIKEKFRLTGEEVTDSGTTFYRIDISAALKPYLNFTSASAQNGLVVFNSSILINVTSDVPLSAAVLELYSSNLTVINLTMSSTSSTNFYYVLEDLSTGTYSYKVYGNDSVNNFGSTVIRTVVVSGNVPEINIFYPENGTYFTEFPGIFNLNVSISAENISSSSYNITNSSGAIIKSGQQSSIHLPGYIWSDAVDISNLTDGQYILSVAAANEEGSFNYISANFWIDQNPAVVSLSSPTNDYQTSDHTVEFSCSSTDTVGLRSISLYLLGSSWVLNQTVNLTGTVNQTIFTPNLNEGSYLWNCMAEDIVGHKSFSNLNRTIVVDGSSPIISAVSAEDLTVDSGEINWVTNEQADSKINYGLGLSLGLQVSEILFISSHSLDLNSLAANTTYFYNITSCDRAGNCATKGLFNFTTLAVPAGSSDGGSGGGSSGGGSSGGGGGGGGSGGGGRSSSSSGGSSESGSSVVSASTADTLEEESSEILESELSEEVDGSESQVKESNNIQGLAVLSPPQGSGDGIGNKEPWYHQLTGAFSLSWEGGTIGAKEYVLIGMLILIISLLTVYLFARQREKNMV